MEQCANTIFAQVKHGRIGPQKEMDRIPIKLTDKVPYMET